MAEGATGGFFHTFVLVSNPQDTPARVTLTYLRAAGDPITVEKTIPAKTRLTTNVADEDPRLRADAVSTVVTSDVPVIAERSMYWPASLPWREGHSSFGVVEADLRWGFADGRVGGDANYHSYILLANPQTETANVKVTYLRERGAPVVETYTVPATSRYNIDVNGIADLQGASFGAVIEVTNQVPIVVERSIYWDADGVLFAGGTNATGIKLPPSAATSPLVDDREITLQTPADVAARRAALIRYIWGTDGFPSIRLPSAIERDDASPVSDLTHLQRVDTLTIGMEAGQIGYAHHFIPLRPNRRLVVLHQGHICTFDDDPAPSDAGAGLRRTIDNLLVDGYSVLAVYMPHYARFTTRLTVDDCATMGHNRMFDELVVSTGSVLKFFLEPVAISLNYLKTHAAIDGFPAYEQFAMAGLSGGGWTTTVYAAIDPTITTSIQIAGTMPLHLLWPASVGDREQTLPEFYRLAGYPDLYVLGAHGPGRAQVQVLNRRDNCCFGERLYETAAIGLPWDDAVRSWELPVRQTLMRLGSGSFRVEIDEAAPAHMISWQTVVSSVLAELNGGLPRVGAATPAHALARGTNGHLWYCGPDAWEDTGLPMAGVPAVLEHAVHRFDVFYRDPSNRARHAYLTDQGWTSEDLGAVILSDPAAASWGQGRIDVVALGIDYQPFHWWSRGGAFQREPVSSSVMGIGALSLVAPRVGSLRLFMRDPFDRELRLLESNGSAPWNATSLGVVMQDFPSAAVTATGKTTVFLRGEDNELWQGVEANQGQWQWTSVSQAANVPGVPLSGSPSASRDPVSGLVTVRTRTRDDRLWAFTRSNAWTLTDTGAQISGTPTSTHGDAYVSDRSGRPWLVHGTMWQPRCGAFD
jgi:hypothetical protein